VEVTGGEGVQEIEAGVEPEEGDRVPRGATALEKAKEPEEAKDGTTGGTSDKVS
jgi:hypothetical protein